MIELFEQDIRTNDRQSSKGNQLKWMNNNKWYKADFTGYEGLVEYVVSRLLSFSNLNVNEYVMYNPIEIKYKNKIFTGVYSYSFLNDDWQIITLERLFKNMYGKSLHQNLWNIHDASERLKYLVNNVVELTGLKDFGKYMNKLLTIDCMFLNEDRHTHNLAVLMDKNGNFDYCPIFDNGAGLLADTTMDYPLGEDIYKLIDGVKSKTISLNFEEQMEVSENLYGMNLKFSFTKKDIREILALDDNVNESCIYPLEIRERVEKIIYEQMRKYPYLF